MSIRSTDGFINPEQNQPVSKPADKSDQKDVLKQLDLNSMTLEEKLVEAGKIINQHSNEIASFKTGYEGNRVNANIIRHDVKSLVDYAKEKFKINVENTKILESKNPIAQALRLKNGIAHDDKFKLDVSKDNQKLDKYDQIKQKTAHQTYDKILDDLLDKLERLPPKETEP